MPRAARANSALLLPPALLTHPQPSAPARSMAHMVPKAWRTWYPSRRAGILLETGLLVLVAGEFHS